MPSSPNSHLSSFFFFVVIFFLPSILVCSVEDAVLLYNFKLAVRRDPSNALASWDLNSKAPPCDWFGVECDTEIEGTGAPVVRGLNLPNKKMEGTLWNDIGTLNFIRFLNLTGNQFTGMLPPSISNSLILVTMDLSYNSFGGPLPPFEKLTQLKTLLLSNNKFQGGFPGSICDGTALQTVDLSYNALTGTISEDISKCSALEVLKLQRNALYGPIPSALAELSLLRVLDLSDNKLTGNFPASVGQIPYLTRLILSYNSLTGFIPPSISATKSLVMLDLRNNLLGGLIPESVGSFIFLEYLSLAHNNFQGSIPHGIGKLTGLLYFLDLSHNQLTGTIPYFLGNLTRLQNVDLSYNMLTGTLPGFTVHCNTLKTFFATSNRLNGPIPSTVRYLSSLEILSLANNFLTGILPPELGNLRSLVVVDLKNNMLTGPIPYSFGSLTNLTFFRVSYNQLTGSLPISLANLTENFDVSNNKLSGLVPNMPFFRTLLKYGFLKNEGSLCGPILNIICPVTEDTSSQGGGIPSPVPENASSQGGIASPVPENASSQGNITSPVPDNSSSVGGITSPPPEDASSQGGISSPAPEDASSLGGITSPAPEDDDVHVNEFLESKEDKMKYLPFLVVSILGVTILMMLVVGLWLKIARPKLFHEIVEFCDSRVSSLMPCFGKRRLSYKDIQLATGNFCSTNVLKCGSRYEIYLGEFPSKGFLTVKVVNSEFVEEERSHFLRECRILSKIDNANVMQMLDWCYGPPQILAAIYKYMARGSLHDNLFGRAAVYLSWEVRLRIAMDVASGLACLHELGKAEEHILLCQLCPHNILLDEYCNAKISGLGVIRTSDPVTPHTPHTSRSISEDYSHYLAPECVSEREITEKGEVYSYGLTILELITRKKGINSQLIYDKKATEGVPPSNKTFLDMLRTLFPYKVKHYVDVGILETATDFDQVLALMEIGLSCTEFDPLLRPNMDTVVSILNEVKEAKLG